MLGMYINEQNIPILDNGKRLTDYKIERIDGNYIFIKHMEYQGVLYLDGKNNQVSEIISPNKFIEISNFDENKCAIAKTPWAEYLIKNDGSICSDPYREIDYIGKGLYCCSWEHTRVSSIIDSEGKIIVPEMNFAQLKENNVKIYKVLHGSCWYNLDDQIVYDDRYNAINTIIDGKIIGVKKGLYGISDEHNNEIIKCKYKALEIIDEDRVLVRTKFGNWKIVDYQDNLITNILELKKDEYSVQTFQKGFALIQDSLNLFGLIDARGNVIVHPKYEVIEHFHNGVAIVKKQIMVHNLINEEGKELLKNEYSSIHYVYGDVYIAEVGTSNFILINSEEKRITNKSYKYMTKLNDFLIEVDSTYKGVIDIHDNELIKPVHNQIKYLENDNLVLAYTSDEINIYQITGNTLIRLGQVSNGCNISTKGNLILINDNTKYCIINRQGKSLVDYINADSVFIVNDNYIIINNVLINISNVDMKYRLDCHFNGELYQNYYNNREDRIKDSQVLHNKFNQLLEVAGFEKVELNEEQKKLRI